MPLASGEQLGPYKILALIGAGGMGEVYRATDTQLKRDVALKVLLPAFARDPERYARFQREAEVLASLNNPNIATLYGLAEDALIMEFVEGQTLPCPLPLQTAVAYAKQIAEALEYAHDRGVIHRDLKPANIKVTPEGAVKLLDFGLAKALDNAPAPSATSDLAKSPTLTLGHTIAGQILGTAAYMAPEQIEGRAADRRADIWSFGVVLFEMLAGKRAFEGSTNVETLASVVKLDPDWSALPKDTPAAIVNLIRRCLAKDRRQRLQAIGEARIALEQDLEPVADQQEVASRSQSEPRKRWVWPAVAAGFAIIAAVVTLLYLRQTPPPVHTLRYKITPPDGVVQSFAISPDGRMLAVAALGNNKEQLWLRPMDSFQFQPMPTTDGAQYPFWSPDSRYIGFFADGKLKKVAASGGPAQSLCDAPNGFGGSWSRDDVIVFIPTPTAVQRVSAAGGTPADVFKNRPPSSFPVFLPDGRHFLFTRAASGAGIHVGSLDGKEDRPILGDFSQSLFAPATPGSRSGHVLFVRENNLMALPFDGEKAQPTGDVFPVTEGITALAGFLGYAPVSVSEIGFLVSGGTGLNLGITQLTWHDRSGKTLGSFGTANPVAPAVSPDEKMVAYARSPAAGNGTDFDIWIRDLARASETRFTTGGGGASFSPFWSPKGDRIVYSSVRGSGAPALFTKPSSGSGKEELLVPQTSVDLANQWSRDGRYIVYSHSTEKNKLDLWYVPLDGQNGERKPAPFLETEFNEMLGQLSPDSHWMAYTSDESGQREVYVRPFPPGDGKWKISTAGGDQPRWRGDAKELYYLAADGKMTAVPLKITAGPKPLFEPGAPVPLFDSHILNSVATNSVFQYDVTADGKRFLVVSTAQANGSSSAPLNVVVNWNAGLKK